MTSATNATDNRQQFGAYQRAEAEQHHLPTRQGAVACRPKREHVQTRAQPRVRQPVLETAGREPPHRSERHEHQRADRDQQGAAGDALLQADRSQDRQGDADEAERNAAQNRDPFEPDGSQDVAHEQRRQPEGAGERLDSLAGVEHRAVPRLDLADHAQVDEAVVVHPAVVPRPQREHDQGERQQPHLDQPAPVPMPTPHAARGFELRRDVGRRTKRHHAVAKYGSWPLLKSSGRQCRSSRVRHLVP